MANATFSFVSNTDPLIATQSSNFDVFISHDDPFMTQSVSAFELLFTAAGLTGITFTKVDGVSTANLSDSGTFFNISAVIFSGGLSIQPNQQVKVGTLSATVGDDVALVGHSVPPFMSSSVTFQSGNAQLVTVNRYDGTATYIQSVSSGTLTLSESTPYATIDVSGTAVVTAPVGKTITCAGAVSVTGGELIVDGSLVCGSDFTVSGTGKLSGSGTVNGNLIQSGGVVSPG